MLGFELKALIVILLIVSIIINIITYKEKWIDKKKFLFGFIWIDEGFVSPKSFWYLLLISFSLFVYGLYLNTTPSIILF